MRKWLRSRVYRCWVINALNLQQSTDTDAPPPIYIPTESAHLFKRLSLQQENVLFHNLYNRKQCDKYVFSQERCERDVISRLESFSYCSSTSSCYKNTALFILLNFVEVNVLVWPSTLLWALLRPCQTRAVTFLRINVLVHIFDTGIRDPVTQLICHRISRTLFCEHSALSPRAFSHLWLLALKSAASDPLLKLFQSPCFDSLCSHHGQVWLTCCSHLRCDLAFR